MILRDINKAKRILYNRQACQTILQTPKMLNKLTRILIFSTNIIITKYPYVVVRIKIDHYI